MDRYALFVDAAYLYAAGGELCCGTKNRAELVMDFPAVLEVLNTLCNSRVQIPALRTYWYDAATDASPTPTHLAVSSLQGVQLRLGRLTAAGQKGVDSRIVRDLIVLSRNRAITDAFLVSGDDDLREGVAEAQEVGVCVHLIGVEPLAGLRNQAPTLLRAADSTLLIMRDQANKFMGRRMYVVAQEPADRRRKSQKPAMPGSVAAEQQATAEEVGRLFGKDWSERNSEEAKQSVLAGKPIIAAEVHRDLVRYAEKQIGALKGEAGEELYRLVAAGFWLAIEE